METGQRPLRVVVQERRRLLREGLAALLGAEADILVVAAVERVEDLADVAGQADALVCSDAAAPLPGSSARVLRLRDEDPAKLIDRLRQDDAEPTHRLTRRETQIMRGVADGMSTGQIGALLGISPKTVENHKQRIFAKLGVQSQAHAVVISHKAGPLEPAVST
ncbi:MAG: response regulator transcription factor [Pseudonocardia sp.]